MFFGQERATGPVSSLRLLHVRFALMVLAESPDPTEGAEELLGRAWLLNQYRHSRIKGWKRCFRTQFAILRFFWRPNCQGPWFWS